MVPVGQADHQPALRLHQECPAGQAAQEALTDRAVLVDLVDHRRASLHLRVHPVGQAVPTGQAVLAGRPQE